MTRTFRCRILWFAFTAAFLVAVSPGHARAQGGCVQGGNSGCSTAPEIDPGLADGGLALLGGAVLVLRGRKKGAGR
jgi:MYXO-CTERM domain-containing protein